MIDVELKNRVKEKIDTIEESYLLEEILNLIDIEKSAKDVFIIPESHKKELEISLNQKDSGLVFSNEIVNKRIAKRLLG